MLDPAARPDSVRGALLFAPEGTRPGDGDTLRVVDPLAYDPAGRPVAFQFRHLSATTNSVPVRLLGVDTPEETYTGGLLPGRTRPAGPGVFPGGVPQQEPWATRAKRFTDAFFRPGDWVHLRLDRETFDRHGRLLAYAFRAPKPRGAPSGAPGWDPADHLNLQLLLAGWACLYQVAPNVAYLDAFRAAAEEARMAGRGMWPDLEDGRTLRPHEMGRPTRLNPPFLYRKVIDAALSGVSSREALRRAGRWVADVEAREVFAPEHWAAVPHARRLFFEGPDDALAAGFRRAPPAHTAGGQRAAPTPLP